MPTTIKNAKIACLDLSFHKARMHQGVQVQITDPKNLDAVRDRWTNLLEIIKSSIWLINGNAYRESDIVKEQIALVLKSGANVVLTTKGIDDLCLKYFIEAGAMAVRRCKKEDLRRICKATGGF